jgi:hypothetical protein
LYVRPWIRTKYWEGSRAVGRFEGDVFDPIKWRPEYPNPAFDNMRADDAFWAAGSSRGSPTTPFAPSSPRVATREPGAAEHIATTLIKRRDKGPARLADRRQPAADARLGNDGSCYSRTRPFLPA